MQRCKSPSVDHYGCVAVCKTVTLRSQACSIQAWWIHGNVAQLAEHSTVNRMVDGSSPSVSAYSRYIPYSFIKKVFDSLRGSKAYLAEDITAILFIWLLQLVILNSRIMVWKPYNKR